MIKFKKNVTNYNISNNNHIVSIDIILLFDTSSKSMRYFKINAINLKQNKTVRYMYA